LLPEFITDADESEFSLLGAGNSRSGEQPFKENVAALLDQPFQGSVQSVIVLLDELTLKRNRNINGEVGQRLEISRSRNFFQQFPNFQDVFLLFPFSSAFK